MFKRPLNYNGTPKTNKEILEDAALSAEKFADNHPLAATAILCGTVHVTAYALLARLVAPPKTSEACQDAAQSEN